METFDDSQIFETPDTTFLTGLCKACQKRVLVVRELSEDDQLIWVCLHCENMIDTSSEPNDAKWVDAAALDDMGYIVEGAQDDKNVKHGKEGGCRSGRCGITQPD